MPATDMLIAEGLCSREAVATSLPTVESSRLLRELMEMSEEARTAPASQLAAFEGIVSPAILRKLLAALHLRDSATVEHSRRVSQIAGGIARHLRWEGANLCRLEIASLLHDIGKIGVPDNILFKPGKLDADESDLMALHHCVSVDVLQAARVDQQVVQIVGQSRDFGCAAALGPGRALGTLHQGARILSVADAYDSLRVEQVYRRAKSHDDAMAILVENKGTQFDGNVISALTRWAAGSGLAASAEYEPPKQTSGVVEVFADPQEAHDADTLARIFSYLYLLENLYDGFYVVDADLRFRLWNGGMHRLAGHPPEELIDHAWSSRAICYADADGRELLESDLPLRQVLQSRRPATRSVKVLNGAATWIDVELQSVPLVDDAGRLWGIAEILRDKSRVDRAPREHRDLRLSAGRDPLTGAANDAELRSQLGQMLESTNQDDWKTPFSLVVCEIDHLREINARFGRSVGDLVLIETARLLQQETYSGETVGRHEGDRFLILCPATAGEQAARRAERVRRVLSTLCLAELDDWPLSGSFGVTQAVSGDTVTGILSRADKALYSATHGGRNQTSYLSPTAQAEPLLREIDGKAGAFEYESQFQACTAAEMIVYKLGGFVNEKEAHLLEVTTERVRMRLGRRTLFSSWGKTDDTQPVDVALEFGSETALRDINGRKVKSNQIQVTVKIVPVGRAKDRDVFLSRARRVLKELTTYFLAEV